MISIRQFQKKIWNYYHQHKRAMPWRQTSNPYKIWVSEIMLQQTQVSRVKEKYREFLKAFPTVRSLADAPLSAVLLVWSGLGYNRRAKFLQAAARSISQDNRVQFPRTLAEWDALPGIGVHTAGAIMTYAYNTPVVFIETNIRTVFLHEFFPDREDVTDAELLPLIEQAVDHDRPREWYWALMDYGAYIKSVHPNPSRRSRHYTQQSKFSGSNRQLRGHIIKRLLASPATLTQLKKEIPDPRLAAALAQLTKEQLITKKHATFHIT